MSALALHWRLRVIGLVLVVPPLVHVAPLPRITAVLGRRPRRGRAAEAGGAAATPVAMLVREVDFWLGRLPWPWRGTCLKRATILYGLLRRAGADVALHVGVKRTREGAFTAHAWLVRDGAPYLEPVADTPESFRVIATFPAESAPA